MKTGVIILSHGSRSPEAQITLQKIKDLVVSMSNYDAVEGASLQFNQPDLPAVLAEMAGRGMNRVIVMPLFLYMGMHMKRDIPEILADQRNLYPDMQIDMTANIGVDIKLAEIVLNRIKEVS